MKNSLKVILASLGGSALLLALPSQASHVPARTNDGMNTPTVGQRFASSHAQRPDMATFSTNYQNAQQRHQITGHWGTAPFYLNKHGTMHVGAGRLNGPYTKVIDMNHVRAISFDDNVQAPQNSSDLFAATEMYSYSNPDLRAIHHLAHLDTSHTVNMSDMFFDDTSLHSLDVSHFDTSHVVNMGEMFAEDDSLSNLDLSHFDTHNVKNMGDMFNYDGLLGDLNISNFDTRNVDNTDDMFTSDDIHHLNLGQDTHLNVNAQLPDTYEQGHQVLNLVDSNASHPGTWVKP